MESQVRPERVTPVVSALAQGPTVEIGPRPQREQFPVLGKSHQQQSPVKRKQNSEQSQDLTESKMKDQQSKGTAPLKHKTATPISESKKQQPQQQQQQPQQQQTPPSQDSDEYVQSVQTKNSEPKTIIIKKNDSDSSGTKTKSDEISKGKESNTSVETKNSNEEIVQETNSNKSDIVKCDVEPTPIDRSPTPSLEDSSGKQVVEEGSASSAAAAPEPEVVPPPAEESALTKTNGDVTAVEEDGEFKWTFFGCPNSENLSKYSST